MLVVDDDADLRQVCAAALEREGYEVTEAASAREAIANAERLRPDVLLTDVSMPGMSGLELIDYLLKEGAPRTTHVLVMSAIASAEPEARARGVGAFLLKPFGLEELLSALDAVLDVPSRRVKKEQAAHFDMDREQGRTAARAMADAAIRAGTMRDPDTLKRVMRVTRWLRAYFEGSTVALFMPSEGQLTIHGSSDGEQLADAADAVALRAIAQTVLETGSTLIIPDVAKQPWLGLPPHDLAAILCVPFRYRGVAIGALCLVPPAARELSAPDAAILEHIASQAATRFTAVRVPFLGASGLVSRNSFQRILAIEAAAAADSGEAIAIALLRVPVEASLGDLLEQLPAGRTQLAELQDGVVAIATRGPYDRARAAVRACIALVNTHAAVQASAEIFVGSPVPSLSERELLAWAERLLAETSEAPGHANIVIDARATWAGPPVT